MSPEPQKFARKATIRVQSSPHGVHINRKSSLCLATVAVRSDTTREKQRSQQRAVLNPTCSLPGNRKSYETALLRARAPSRLRVPPASATAVAASIPAYFELVMAVVVASYLVHSVYMSLAVGKARRTWASGSLTCLSLACVRHHVHVSALAEAPHAITSAILHFYVSMLQSGELSDVSVHHACHADLLSLVGTELLIPTCTPRRTTVQMRRTRKHSTAFSERIRTPWKCCLSS